MGLLIIFNATIFLPKSIELKILKKIILFSAKNPDFLPMLKEKVFEILENSYQFVENFMLIQKMYNICSKIKEKFSYIREKNDTASGGSVGQVS